VYDSHTGFLQFESHLRVRLDKPVPEDVERGCQGELPLDSPVVSLVVAGKHLNESRDIVGKIVECQHRAFPVGDWTVQVQFPQDRHCSMWSGQKYVAVL